MHLTRLRDFERIATVTILAVTALFLVLPSQAAPRIVLPPALQQAALLCLGEALRLCPDALKAKDHGISCIKTKRHLLSVPCRGVYDQGVSFLHGGDVHLDLRSLQRKAPRPGSPKVEPVPVPGQAAPGG